MNKKQPIAYLICGFIGAGKSTYSRELHEKTGAIRISKDEWIIKIFGNRITFDKNFEEIDRKVTDLATDIAFKILKSGADVILDEGFWSPQHRDEMRKRVQQAGAEPIFYYVECSVELMRERVVNRSKNPPDDSFEITEEMFNSYLKDWQPPDESENVIVIKSSEL